MHLILNGTEKVVAVVWVADLDGLGEVDHLLEKLLVDGLVDVDTLGGYTDLTGVLECAHDNLRSDLLNVDVWQDDRGVIASELKGNALECAGGGLHNLLSGSNGSGEGDLGDVWVTAHGGTEVVVAANNLENTRRQDLLGELGKLEGGVGCERRRLDDHAVTGHECWCNLARGENEGEVPWADGSTDTKGRVLGVDGLLVVLNLLTRDIEGEMVADEGRNCANLNGGKFPLWDNQLGWA